MTMRFIVVGAGIFGVTAALELQRRGHQVVLMDPGPLPHPEASSTDICKVIRMDYGADEFTMALMEEAMQGWRRWNADWPVPLYHQVGFVLLTHKRMKAGTFEGDSYQLLKKRGHRPERLEPASIAERFPQWAEAGYVDGYFNPEAGWAESGRVVAALLTRAQEAGVELAVGEPVLELLSSVDQSPGVRTRQGLVQADGLVLAAGAWSPSLLPELSDKVWPVGQPVMHFEVSQIFEFQPPNFVPWASDIEETGWYGFPAQDDGVLKMANHGPGRRMMPGQAAQIRPQDEARFREFLREHLPTIAMATRRCGGKPHMCRRQARGDPNQRRSALRAWRKGGRLPRPGRRARG